MFRMIISIVIMVLTILVMLNPQQGVIVMLAEIVAIFVLSVSLTVWSYNNEQKNNKT